MIIALLFLIVLCLLFPGLMRLAAVLLLFGFLYLVAQATAEPWPSGMHDALAYCRSPDVDPAYAMDGKHMLTDKECARRFLKDINPAAREPTTLRSCEELATSPERGACKGRVLRNCPKTPLKAWKACWDSH